MSTAWPPRRRLIRYSMPVSRDPARLESHARFIKARVVITETWVAIPILSSSWAKSSLSKRRCLSFLSFGYLPSCQLQSVSDAITNSQRQIHLDCVLASDKVTLLLWFELLLIATVYLVNAFFSYEYVSFIVTLQM